jgi:hypothetical protein
VDFISRYICLKRDFISDEDWQDTLPNKKLQMPEKLIDERNIKHKKRIRVAPESNSLGKLGKTIL